MKEENSQGSECNTSRALPPGLKLGNYTIIRPLGCGECGVTYLAHDLKEDCDIVIKEFLPTVLARRDSHTFKISPADHSSDAATYAWALDCFLSEARSLMRLHHDSIAHATCSFRALGTAYYTLPWVEGTTIDTAAPAPSAMKEEWLTPILEQLLSALACLHGNNMLHADIRPANIIWNAASGKAVLIEFGTAHARISERTASTPASNAYTPIEQLTDMSKMGPWSDIYALGSTCYTLITGEALPSSTERAKAEDTYRPLAEREQLHERFSPSFLAAIDRALALQPEERWQTVLDWHTSLHAEEETPEDEPAVAVAKEVKEDVEDILPPHFELPARAKAEQKEAPRKPEQAPQEEAAQNNESEQAARYKELQEQLKALAVAIKLRLNKKNIAILSGSAAGIVLASGIWAICSSEEPPAIDPNYTGVCVVTDPNAPVTSAIPLPVIEEQEVSATNENTETELSPERKAQLANMERATRFIESFIEAQRHHELPKAWMISHLSDELSLHKNIFTGLQALVEQGQADAMYVLSCAYMDGLGCDQAPEEAIKLLQQAAEKGFAHAQHALGYRYQMGLGVDKQPDKAVSWYRMAHSQEHIPATCSLADCYRTGEGVDANPEEALALYNKAADAGNPKALNALGVCHLNAIGCEKDIKRSFEYFLKAAEHGCALSMAQVAACYLIGIEGVPQDKQRAQSWFCHAISELVLGAECGEVEYQATLGIFYQNGHGCVKDINKAFRWFREAADQGHSKSMYYVGLCYEQGTGTAQNLNKAFECYQKAAEYHYPEALYKVGYFYQEGMGGAEKDIEEAFCWFQRAAKYANAKALVNLGVCYETGQGVAEDPTQAFECYSRAAEMENEQGYVNLGMCYLNGTGVTIDRKKAYENFNKAAQLGHPAGMQKLGRCYETGVGTNRHIYKAQYWYQKAAQMGNTDAQTRLKALGKTW